MKRILFGTQVILFGLFGFSLMATILQLFGQSNPLTQFDHNEPVYDHIEQYDPSLARLNSIDKLRKYCDSLYQASGFTGHQDQFIRDYTGIVSSVIRKRFFFGYSYYGFNSNYMALLMSKATIHGLSAIVIPDDILKYPFAACSQQSIVFMEVLHAKGIATRKISLKGKISGHFCFEVFYNGGWHFHDPSLEPDRNVLNSYDRPGIVFLVSHRNILLKAYNRYPPDEILDIFPNYTYGDINKFPAPRAIIFQKLTKFLSYTGWLFFLTAFLAIRRKYLQLPQLRTGVESQELFPAI